ncbi:ABC transporter substrate-binding protein [Streptomyces sp. NPDC086091]|uniref:ABC transporter substrate-binding protein n=1 Tax=Streptomyces sp. NPDC086091 TaxID=3365751 RepID=UPI0037F783A2
MKRRLAGLVLAAMLTASCAGGGGTGAKPKADEPVPLTVGTLAISATAPLELARREGYFADEGLKVSLKYIESPAAVPSVMSGAMQFAWLSAPAVLVARDNGVPVVSVADGVTIAPRGATGVDLDTYQINLLTKTGGPIRSPKDLEGRKVGVNAFFQLPDLSVRNALRESGVDVSKIEFIEVPMPQMGAALDAGRIDAANASEPFVTLMTSSKKAQVLLSAGVGQEIGTPQSVLVSSEKYLKGNPEVVKAFQRAVDKATRYAADHPDEVRAIVPTYTTMPPEAAAKIRLGSYGGESDRAGWEKWADILKKEDVLKKEPDVGKAFVEPTG